MSVMLKSVWGSGSKDVWAVGDGRFLSDGVLLHYDGTSWTWLSSGTTNPLYGVWGTSAGDVWAVGSGGTILHH
jgi:hypothetical protein